MPELRRVLHVLPHPGGGGETYVDALSAMEGYRLERAYLAAGPDPAGARASILRRAVEIQRAARAHELLHVHGEVASGLCLPALATRPSVVTLHGLNLVRRLSGFAQTAARVNLRLVIRAASRTVCVSESEREELRSLLGERFLRRVVAVQNGITPPERVTADERTAARAALDIPMEAMVGAWIGGLEAVKDPLTPIRAVGPARRLGIPLVLLVAGDGPLRAEVERAATDVGDSSVQVLGFRREIRKILAAADFFVLSSRSEGLSFSLLEAMAVGLAPVVSAVPGNREAVGDAGVLVPVSDTAAFTAAFERLATDEQGRLDLGKRARERVTRHFRAQEMIGRTRCVYDRAILERRRRGDAGAASP